MKPAALPPGMVWGKCAFTGIECACWPIMVVTPSGTDKFIVSDSVYMSVAGGSDEKIAELWIALKESRSSGYTDASFADVLARDVRSVLHGRLLLCVAFGSPYMAVAVQTSIAARWIITRSARPVFPSLEMQLAKRCQSFVAPGSVIWLGATGDKGPIEHRRWAVATMDNQELAFEASPTMGMAVASQYKIKGEQNLFDPFLALANAQSDSGYELIRRGIL